MKPDAAQYDTWLPLALWLTAALTIVAVLLGGFYVLLLMSAGIPKNASIATVIVPLLYVGTCIVHWDVLARARHLELPQYGLPWLTFVALGGLAAWVTMTIGNFSMHHGPSAILLLPTAIGILSNAVVWQILWQAWQTKQQTPLSN